MTGLGDKLVVVGRISGLYGVRGWVKIFSYTQPRENIVNYSPWLLRRNGSRECYEIAEGRKQGKGIVAHLAGIDDRDAAAALVGSEILVAREQFPEAGDDEFFWTDLIGLRVETEDGRPIGVVDHLMETGANDVLVVDGEQRVLVPFVMNDIVKRVDIDGGLIIVDWDPGYR